MFNNGKARIIVPRIAAVLLVLVMASTVVTLEIYARYTTSISASDDMRIANFITSVDFAGTDDLLIDCYNNYETSYIVNVTNSDSVSVAETTIEYSVVLILPDALTENEMTVSIDGKQPTTVSADGKTITFEKLAVFSPGTVSEKSFKLTFSMKQDDHGIYYAPLATEDWDGITLKVHAKQVN